MAICGDMQEFQRCWGFIEKALEQEIGGLTFSQEDVLKEIAAGNALLFTASKSATLVNVIQHPRCRVLNVWASGGSLKEILGITLPEIEAWGRENGCSFIIGSGRDAWGRVLKKHGFAPHHVTFAKEL